MDILGIAILFSKDEPSLDKIANSVDLLSFSGDKLFGSAVWHNTRQEKYINQLKKKPALRMLRVDKITLSILGFNYVCVFKSLFL